MSHFIIWSISAMYFGTPNGQASTQFEQPMQRGLSADCTMPLLGLLDRVGRAHLGAGRVLAVHAHHRRGLRRRGPVDALEVDQRLPAVRAALLARLHARLAADAAALVDHEDRCVVDAVQRRRAVMVPPAGRVAFVGGRYVPAGASTRTAATLNSGIFDSRVERPGS